MMRAESQEESSSQGSTAKKAPWCTPFVMAMNKTQNRPLKKRPHNGRVVGAGVGHKFKQHYDEETLEERKERKKAEAKDLEENYVRKADLPDLIQDGVASTLLTIVQQLRKEDEDNRRQGSGASAGASNTTPPAAITADVLERMLAAVANTKSASAHGEDPAASEADRHDPQALVVRRSSPAISASTPIPRVSTLEELNALTVITNYAGLNRLLYILALSDAL